MVHYGASENVRAAVSELACAHPGPGWLCRHSVDMTRAEIENPFAVLETLLARFEQRFGSPPTFPT
jgi:hypothetical protein